VIREPMSFTVEYNNLCYYKTGFIFQAKHVHAASSHAASDDDDDVPLVRFA